MGKVVIEESTLFAIGDAIREKTGTTAGLDPKSEMPGAILAIQGAEVEEITNSAGGKSVYINSEVPKLPDGYTRLQYTQSTGSQYIDTGFQPDQDTRVVMDLQGATTTSGVYMHYGVTGFMAGKASNNSWNYYAYYGTQELAYSARTASDFITRHTVDQNKNVITTGADTKTLTAETFSSNYSMYLFGVNSSGSLVYASPIKVFSCQIYDNDVLVRDYVPALNAGGVAGLYDLVNGVFYADAAGGSFVAGPVMLEYELPEGYEELEYIKSDGNQYADTGFKPNNNTRVVMDAQLLSTSAAGFYFGARASGYVDSFGVLFSSSAGALRSAYGSQNLSFATTNYTQKVHIDKNKTSCQLGSETLTHTAATFQNTYNMYLFASNEFGSVGSKAKMSLWGCQIYDNGTLIRYYVPCKNNNGEVGLWDAVNNTFTGDAAGVGFLAGPSKGVSKVVLEDQVLIDLTGDTVTPESLLSGFTAHDAMGQMIQGAASAGRPFASGTVTANSTNVATVSGLSFKPSVVFMYYNNQTSYSNNTNMSVLADIDGSFYSTDRAAYDSSTWSSYYNRSGGTTVVKLTVTESSFTITLSSGRYGGSYRWYAIG